MNWTNITSEFPEEGSIVFVKVARRKNYLLCQFKNDSFGLGDLDFRVSKWRYVVPPRSQSLRSPYYSPRSTLQAEDRKLVYSLG